VPGLDPVVTYRRSRWRRLVGDIPYVNDLHSGSQPIEGIHVAVGAADYRLAAAASSITCRVETTGPAGAATSTVLPFARWIADMTSAVAERSRMAHESLAALENLIVYDRPH